MNYATGRPVEKGPVELSFAVRQDPPAPGRFWVELRDYQAGGKGEYYAGASLGVRADAAVMVNKQEVAKLPPGEWSHVAARLTLGADQPKDSRVEVTLSDGSKRSARAPFPSKDFTVLTALIISADGDEDGAFFLDDLKLAVEE